MRLRSERASLVVPKWYDALRLAAAGMCCVAIFGCTAPVSIDRVGQQTAYRERARNVLSSGALSEPTRIVLTRWSLNERFPTDPEGALSILQDLVNSGKAGDDEIYALSELSFQHAALTGQRTYYLAASVYAFAFLFPGGEDTPPSPYDPRLRFASDLYNRGLTLAFESADRVEG